MSLPDGLPLARYPPRIKYRKALMLTVSMAEIAHKMKYYEVTAVCARKIAEMYVSLMVPDFTSLYEGVSKLPYDMDENVWNALREAQTIGNEGARDRTSCDGVRRKPSDECGTYHRQRILGTRQYPAIQVMTF